MLGLGLVLVGVVVSCAGASPTATQSLVAPRSPAPAPTLTGPSIGGHVRDAAGSGIAGISVKAVTVGGGATMAGISGSDGLFAIIGLTSGNYVVQFTDQLAAHPNGYYATAGLTLAEDQATHITVGTSPVSGIDVVLPTGYSLSGTVHRADGTPIPGVEVFLCPYLASSCTTYPTWTARDGTYLLAGIAPGKYTVNFSDPWQHQPSGLNLPDVTIAGASVSGFDQIAPSGWITPGAAIHGLVTTITGDPMPGVQVSVTGAGATNTYAVKTAADGSYFFGLAAGTYTLLFDAPLYAYHGSTGMAAKQADAAPIVLSGSNAVEIDAAISFPDAGIWKLLPTRVGTTHLVAVYDVVGSRLTDYIATIPADSFASDLLASMGKTKADILEIVSARDHPELGDASVVTMSIYATRYSGATADQISRAYETAYGKWSASHSISCSASRIALAGKTLIAGACNGQPVSLYVYAHDDTLFEITAKDSATAQAVVSALP